jgi:S-adenosylmethionine:tRNA ribosyltransferase-isomerase
LCQLPTLLQQGDVLVLNDTKVIPARFSGKVGQAKVEITIIKRLPSSHVRAFAKPAKKMTVGSLFYVTDDCTARVVSRFEHGEVELAFNQEWDVMKEHGSMPLPPYMNRHATEEDRERYQTVFASEEGAVAAPTAGLHFTESLLSALKTMGVEIVYVTLHVGAGTFLPVKTEYIADHVMHTESYKISEKTADVINNAVADKRRIVAVGTTSLRVLESAVNEEGRLAACEGETALFITPGYHFKLVQLLLTNFHLPQSTLLMLISAFAGVDEVRKAYAFAKETGYRFYSYGDACLLERKICL